ncbi:MAG TPA: ABC transporter ATP-binding protein [Methanospirillum sp.]|nr:ABC transporter ATP-binding protein [Methanospirillum sp.]
MLELIQVSKHYHTRRFQKKTFPAVDNVSLSIEPGKTFGLVGESGSGKTTVGLLASRLILPSKGEVFINGINIQSKTKKEDLHLRRKIQIIFQNNESALDPRMSLSTLIQEPLIVHHVDASDTAVLHLMERVGLGKDLKDRYPHELSGGQRQRICIARAIALNPQYLIADEPAASLDYSVQAQILELLTTLQKEKNIGMLFISHHLKIIRVIADIIAVMFNGRIVEKGLKESVFNTPLHPYTRDLMSSLPGLNRRDKILFPITPEPDNRTSPLTGCRYYSRCRRRGEICLHHEPELKDRGDGHYVACHNASASS